MRHKRFTFPASQTFWKEVIRFGLTGTLAVGIQYATYYALTGSYHHNVAFVVSYAVSFLFNFFCTTFFTFRVKPDWHKLAGFLFCHLVNFGLQMLLLNAFIAAGLPKSQAMLPVFLICVPTNFLLVRKCIKR